jgi:flagella basal body P-ring formation protein FlgA
VPRVESNGDGSVAPDERKEFAAGATTSGQRLPHEAEPHGAPGLQGVAYVLQRAAEFCGERLLPKANAAIAALTRAAIVGILTLVSVPLTRAALADAPEGWQSPDSIRAAARALVMAEAGEQAIDVETVAVDERLKLPRCSQALHAELQNPLRSGRGTVAVSCAGATPWRLYVPVRAVQQIEVLITRRSVQAGTILSAEDFVATPRPSTALPLEYLTDAQQAVGLTVRRTIPAGTVLAPGVLDFPQLVERGSLVTLISSGGPVFVKSEGVALEPGRLKQRIRVRSQSGRVVEGMVQAQGQVRVGS